MQFKLDHINLTVDDIKKSVAWYSKVFGMELLESGEGAGTKWVIVGRNDSMICMTEDKSRSKAREILEGKVHQVYHFGFRVPDEKKWQDTVNEYGLELFYGGVNHYPNSRSWYVKDPSGHMIEVSYTDSDQLSFNP